MRTLILSKEDVVKNFLQVAEILASNAQSFTAYNITQILRSTGVFYKHETVRRLVADMLELEFPYRKLSVKVDDLGTSTILYTTLNFDLPEDFILKLDLSNFAPFVKEYKEWFSETYDFDFPEEASDSAEIPDVEQEQDSEEEPRVYTRGPCGRFTSPTKFVDGE